MRALDNLAASLVHDCGTRLQVPIERLAEPYHCSDCGRTDQIDAAKVPGIMADVGETLLEVGRRVAAGHEHIRIQFNRDTRAFNNAAVNDG